MAVLLQREIDALKSKIFILGAAVEDNVLQAVQSVEERNLALAERVIQSDRFIDQVEVDLEEDCLKILALHQPVAIDLRFIVAVLKINNDLERIGDLAVNIAERAMFLHAQPAVHVPFDLQTLTQKAHWMVRSSLAAQMNLDADLARRVCQTDDDVDAINRSMYDNIKEAISLNPGQVSVLIPYLTISRNLERVADHATNIAEDVIYMVEGIIARHRTKEYKEQSDLSGAR